MSEVLGSPRLSLSLRFSLCMLPQHDLVESLKRNTLGGVIVRSVVPCDPNASRKKSLCATVVVAAGLGALLPPFL